MYKSHSRTLSLALLEKQWTVDDDSWRWKNRFSLIFNNPSDMLNIKELTLPQTECSFATKALKTAMLKRQQETNDTAYDTSHASVYVSSFLEPQLHLTLNDTLKNCSMEQNGELSGVC